MLYNYISECAGKRFGFHQTGFLVMSFIFNQSSLVTNINTHQSTVCSKRIASTYT